MRKFSTALMAKRYLDETLQLNDENSRNLNRVLEQGLQEIMALQKKDGSFDLWGTNHRADIWKRLKNSFTSKDYLDLTAYIVKLLAQYEVINPGFSKAATHSAMKYIKNKQKPDGSFEVNGEAQFRDLNRLSEVPRVALTAYILIGILESEYLSKNYQSIVQNGLRFIDDKFDTILREGTNYEKALTYYLYALAGKNHEQVLNKLNENTINSENLRFWQFKGKDPSSAALQIEVSSYVALGLIHLKRYEDVLPIINFLMSKRNPKGGFESTVPTVVALQALSDISKALYEKESDMQLSLRNQHNEEVLLRVNARQRRATTENLSPSTRRIDVTATGKGVASLQVSCEYKVKLENFKEYFDITASARMKSEETLDIAICVKTVNRQKSDMAVMEVSLPSGFTHHHGPHEDADNLKVRFC